MISSERAWRLVELIKKSVTLDGRRPRLIPVGSLRRGEKRHGDLDFIVLAERGEARDLRFGRAGAAPLRSGPRRLTVALRAGRGAAVSADFFMVRRAELPYALFHYTGSRAYNIRTRALARRKGWRLNQYSLSSRATGRRLPRVASERALARQLGVSYRAPADRVA